MMKEKVIKKGFVEKHDIRKDRGIKMIEGGGIGVKMMMSLDD